MMEPYEIIAMAAQLQSLSAEIAALRSVVQDIQPRDQRPPVAAASKPTVGRIVHFYTSDPTAQANGIGAGPYAAIVTQVFDLGLDRVFVNLAVFRPFGEVASEGSVSHRDQETAPCRYWVWPPRE